MKKILVFAVVALMTMTASAQIEFGVKGGLNITTMSLDKSVLSASNRSGFFIGPTLKASVLGLGLGADVSVLYDQRETSISYSNTTSEPIKLREIAIPINARYQIGLGDVCSLVVFAGPQFGFNISNDKDKTLISDVLNWEWKTANLSVNVGAGVMALSHLMISANYNIACGSAGEFKLSKISESLKDFDTSGKMNSWQIGLTYYF